MKFLTLFGFCMALGIFCQEANAQVCPQGWGWPRHASTVGESHMNGVARIIASRGIAANHYGWYLRNYEAARHQYIQNWENYVRTKWAIRDEYRARQLAKRSDPIELRHRLLDNLERHAELEAREEELRKKGLLPPKKEPGFWHDGKKFTSIEEWRKSPEYAQQMEENRMKEFRRQVEKQQAEARRQQSVRFGQMWSRMSWLQKHRWNNWSPEKKQEYIDHWDNNDYWLEKYKREQARKFYDTRPYLLPQAGKNGLPEVHD